LGALLQTTRIDLRALIVGIVAAPSAPKEIFDEVKLWINVKQHSYPVRKSELG
jgi:hypothetical protein